MDKPPTDGTVFLAYVYCKDVPAPGQGFITAMAYCKLNGYQPTLYFHGALEPKKYEIKQWVPINFTKPKLH